MNNVLQKNDIATLKRNHFLKKRNNLVRTKTKNEVNILKERRLNRLFKSAVADIKSISSNTKVVDVKFPKVQKIVGNIGIKKFPKVQKVDGTVNIKNDIKVKNLSEITQKLDKLLNKKFFVNKRIQKVSLDREIEIPDTIKIGSFPFAEGETASKKADPTKYIPIRLSDGKKFVDGLFGGGSSTIMGGSALPETWTTTSGTIGIASSLVLVANDMRKIVVLTNDSDTPIYLAFGADAEAGMGIRLNAEGGAYEINQSNMFKGTIHAISRFDGKNLCVLEVSKTLD